MSPGLKRARTAVAGLPGILPNAVSPVRGMVSSLGVLEGTGMVLHVWTKACLLTLVSVALDACFDHVE